MENEFNKRGLETLKKMLPNYSFHYDINNLTMSKNEKSLIFHTDFNEFFKLIDDDLLRMQDSSEIYFYMLSGSLEKSFNEIL
jgi:hypothetical protein